MTKDEAIQKITESLGAPANGSMLAENQSYAQRLAAAMDALGLLSEPQPASQQRNQSHEPQDQDPRVERHPDPHQATHHRVDTAGTVSTPHPMTQSQHGVTPGGNPEGQSWRRQPQPTPEDTTGAA